MDGDISNALYERRRPLGGAVLLLVGIVVAAVVLWPGGDDSPAKPKRLPARIVSVPPLGMGFAHPTSWKRKVSKAVIGVRSPEGSVVVFFSSPLARPAVEEVRAGAKEELLKQFKPASIVHEGTDQLGVHQVPSFELLGKDKGKTVRALELVDSTKYRTYAVTIVTSAKPSSRRLKEARAIISTVRFTKPKATTPAKTK
jgi:hypothetical protein